MIKMSGNIQPPCDAHLDRPLFKLAENINCLHSNFE